MIPLSLRTKILLFVGLLVSLVWATSTYMQIQGVERNYLQALGWRSEVIVRDLLFDILKMQHNDQVSLQDSTAVSAELSPSCRKLYDVHKDEHITHIAVVNTDGVIIAHNDETSVSTSIPDTLRDQLPHQPQLPRLLDEVYHTLVPIVDPQDISLGVIDIGVHKRVLDRQIRQLLLDAASLFAILLVLALIAVWGYLQMILSTPIKSLVTAGERLSEGKPVNSIRIPQQDDEISSIARALNWISAYLRNVTDIALHVGAGNLDDDVRVRSRQDVLGNALHEMLNYLKHVALVASKIAEGDLTEHVHIRSEHDTFGKVIDAMRQGLQQLFSQISRCVTQIASTGETISSLVQEDIDLVQELHTSNEHMMTTMEHIHKNSNQDAQDLLQLSSIVQTTSDSVWLMISSVGLLASNATELSERSQHTIGSLKEAVTGLEHIVENTNTSKQVSEQTIAKVLDGQKKFEQVVSSMDTIQRTVMNAVEIITRLAQRSQDIEGILQVIRNITDQTSLLSLNASIIAAQAGSHGKGFAVVADEIRSLADGVGASTKDIAAIVQTLQQDTNLVVQTIHEGVDNVKQGIERTQETQEALKTIIHSAQQSSTVVGDIADALQELTTTNHTVVTAMEEIHELTNDFTMAAKEQETNTGQVDNALQSLTNFVSQFQESTNQRITRVNEMLDATQEVTRLIAQNLVSSQNIVTTTGELASQTDTLLQSVDRFKLEE